MRMQTNNKQTNKRKMQHSWYNAKRNAYTQARTLRRKKSFNFKSTITLNVMRKSVKTQEQLDDFNQTAGK